MGKDRMQIIDMNYKRDFKASCFSSFDSVTDNFHLALTGLFVLCILHHSSFVVCIAGKFELLFESQRTTSG